MKLTINEIDLFLINVDWNTVAIEASDDFLCHQIRAVPSNEIFEMSMKRLRNKVGLILKFYVAI